MTTDEQDVSPELAAPAVGSAWDRFAATAQAAVHELQGRYGVDLWMVTAVDVELDCQTVVASAGPWAADTVPGLVSSWAHSFCRRMVAEGGACNQPDVRDGGSTQSCRHPRVGAYLGVPLLGADGRLLGTLCALAGQAHPATLAVALEPARFIATLLSTILAGEQRADELSRDADRARTLASRDPLTGLRNRRGWYDALAVEEQRCRRYGSKASVLVLDLDGLKRVNDQAGHHAGDRLLVACGVVLTTACRPGDVLARIGGDEFGVLAVECGLRAAKALSARLRVDLRSAGAPASVGCTTRRFGEGLAETWQRADEVMYRTKRGRQARHPDPTRGYPVLSPG